MINGLPQGSFLDTLVPMSRFGKGEWSAIFDEVNRTGCKIVVKNDVPSYVLLTTEKYRELLAPQNSHPVPANSHPAPAGSGVSVSNGFSAPAVKPEIKPEIKPDIKSDIKPEIKPDIKPDIK